MSLRRTRLLKEISLLKQGGLSGALLIENFDDSIETLSFELCGPEGTPFAKKTLKLEMKLTKR